MGKLTAPDVARAGTGMHPDGNGLYLQVGSGGARSWIYRFAINGKQRYLGLGSATAIPLKRARELAAEARQLRAEGIDPLEHRRDKRAAERIELAKAMTFDDCAAAYIAAHTAGWLNAKHRAQWTSTLRAYVSPIIGNLPVHSVDVGLVMKIIKPLWSTKPETAGRVRGRIESILDWAKVMEYRQGENPARWRGHLEYLLPKKSVVSKVVHHAALPYTEIPVFMAELRRRPSISAKCLEVTILAAVRTSEAIGACWGEIDFETRVWTIPAARMKGRKERRREHRIPLSQRLIDVLGDLYQRRAGEFVFPGGRVGKPLSNMAMLKVLALTGRTDLTVHGFRSTFRDWAAEQTDFSSEVVEQALAHAVGSKVEAAYRRGDVLDKRRRLMEAWADYCDGTASAAGKALPLRAV